MGVCLVLIWCCSSEGHFWEVFFAGTAGLRPKTPLPNLLILPKPFEKNIFMETTFPKTKLFCIFVALAILKKRYYGINGQTGRTNLISLHKRIT